MHNRTKREIAQEQRYLAHVLGTHNIERTEAARQRTLMDAKRHVERRFRGEAVAIIDYGLKPSLESRNPDGWCEAGVVYEDAGLRRWWLIRWRVTTGERVLRRCGSVSPPWPSSPTPPVSLDESIVEVGPAFGENNLGRER